ncbi:ABC transporter permease subunit [Cohnella sp. NL03-T5]|nr:ABC transporter permease subunit [Cohnella silvisoli]
MAAPFILLVIAFNYVPLFGWVYAFYDYKPGIPLADTPFVGLKFFKLALEDGSELGNIIRNTLGISALSLLISPLPLILAILLSEVRSKLFKNIVQTITTLPHFISWVIVFSIMFSLFSNDGLVNQQLLNWGWIDQPSNPLSDSSIAWYVQTAISAWKTVGFSAIIYLAAIAGIDQEQYEAAKVDGAGRFRQILHITIPGSVQTYLVLLLLSVSNMLSNGFEQFFVFFNPMVSEKLEVLDYYVYRVGIQSADYAYSTALGIFKTIISIALLFTVNFISKRTRGNSIF